MIDDITQKNLLSFSSALTAVKEAADKAWQQTYGFLEIYGSFRKLRPYINNLVLFCNEHLGANIALGSSECDDLIGQADECKRLIAASGKFIDAYFQHKDEPVNVYSRECPVFFGKLLQKINSQPPEQAFLNRYFMKGTLETLNAFLTHRRQHCIEKFSEKLEDEQVTEKIEELLALQGISLSTKDKDLLDEAVYTGCDELLNENTVLTPALISNTIIKSVKQSLNVKTQNLQTAVGSQQNVIFNILTQTKEKMHRTQAVRRDLLLFGRNIAPISHQDTENMVYLSRFKENVKIEHPVWDSAHELPSYLRPYRNDAGFKNIMKQMKFWEDYEANADAFDKGSVYQLLGKLNMRRLGCLYEDLNFYEEQLDEWRNANINEGKNGNGDEQNEYPDSAQLRDVLGFAFDLEEATRHGSKYSGLELNDTGIGESTLKKLQSQKTWRLQDISLLEDFFQKVGTELDENLPTINASNKIEYEPVIDAVLAMPHSIERYNALRCLEGTLDTTYNAIDDDFDMTIGEIDGQIGHLHPEINQLIADFLNTGTNTFSDLKNEDPEELSRQMRYGILSTCIIPVYLDETAEDYPEESLAAFIQNYDDYSPETKSFILGLEKYYASKTMPFHQKAAAAQNYPEALKNNLEQYKENIMGQNYLDILSDSIVDAKQEEEQLLSDYENYKKQKAMYELPDNFDVILAAAFYGRRKGRG